MTSQSGVVSRSSLATFGFIASDLQQNDIYYHIDDVVGRQVLLKGDRVHFELATENGELRAKQVQLDSQSGLEAEWFAAVLMQNCVKLRFLAEAGQDLNAMLRSEWNCLRCKGTGTGQSMRAGDIKISRRIWACGHCKGTGHNVSLPTAICLAVQHEKSDSLKAIIELGADVCKQMPLLEAVSKGNPDFVKLLLEAHADPNIEHEARVPLCSAARNGHTSIAVMLLDSGAQVCLLHDSHSDEGELVTADRLAVRHGHHDTARAIQIRVTALALPALPAPMRVLVCKYCRFWKEDASSLCVV